MSLVFIERERENGEEYALDIDTTQPIEYM